MRYFVTLICLAFVGRIFSQNIGINVTGAAPNVSALLDVDGSGLPANAQRGILFPRVALTATNIAAPVVSPATSLVVYNTETAGTTPDNVIPGFYYWDGAAWKSFCGTTTLVCPSGFARIPGRNYCIEINERPQTDWDGANSVCQSLGYRLCEVGEWRDACPNQATAVNNSGVTVPLQNMTGNYEWTADIGGNLAAIVLGTGSCSNIGEIDIYTVSPRFRCCFSP